MSRRSPRSKKAAFALFQSTGRDFVCSFIVFVVLFAVMAPENSNLQSLSVFSAVASGPAMDFPFAALSTAPFEAGGYHFSDFANTIRIEQAAAAPSQMTMIVAAIVFSAMVAFNLAFFRHLRRVHASSRRGAWRGS